MFFETHARLVCCIAAHSSFPAILNFSSKMFFDIELKLLELFMTFTVLKCCHVSEWGLICRGPAPRLPLWSRLLTIEKKEKDTFTMCNNGYYLAPIYILH